MPLDHIAKVPKAGAGLASDGTQTAHGLNYHHAQNAGGEGYYFYMPTVSLMGPGALKKVVRDMGGSLHLISRNVFHETSASRLRNL